MKKFTFLILAIIMANYGIAQTISFEVGEGYALGNINTQTGLDMGDWESSLGGGVTPLTNQIISAERATDGSNSLKLVNEGSFLPQTTANTGAFYNYSSLIDMTAAEISFDIYIDAAGLNQSDISDFEAAFRNGSTNITTVIFSFDGFIGLNTNTQADGNGGIEFKFAKDDSSGNFINWSSGTWYNIRLEINNPNVALFIDGTKVELFENQANDQFNSSEIYTVTPNLDMNRVKFAHSNYLNSYFIDNFETNDEVLSVDEISVNKEDFRYLSTTKELLLKNSGNSLENISVFNLLGQQVLAQQLTGNEERINVQNLSNGIYVAQITVGSSIKTLKFAKQ